MNHERGREQRAATDPLHRSAARRAIRTADGPAPTTDWYRDAVIYQFHVRSFVDGDDDGTGDFDGLTSRLDYFTDLGVDALWLLPFYPSPLRDDGYDISDYRRINPAYGDLAAFRRFLSGAHDRGLKVIIELVLNHTSDSHPWFQRARRSPPGSPARAYYVWSDSADRYPDARIIFRDFETSNWTWDPVAGQYFWHRFYSHQPDLNFESPLVRRAMLATVRWWFRLGVDGVRLDAVPYLFEAPGTNCENLPATHAFLKELRAHVDERFVGKMLLAEANQWPEDAVAYFGNGDECHMAFHFPLMPRLFLGLQMEDRTPIVDIIEQTPHLPDGCQWALFLRNHDELTLEMVTDEERDYMYRRYARDPRMRINLGIRRRLAPLLQDDRRRIELLTGLLFSLQGTPIIYYGDEIGMGDNVHLGDRDAVRTPMQWTADRNGGFSRAHPDELFLPVITDPQHHYEALNVEAQRANRSSLWWWTRRLIRIRRRHRALARGHLTIVETDNPRILAFVRHLHDDGTASGAHADAADADILVIANLSRHPQEFHLRLPARVGWRPVELFGQSPFAPLDSDTTRFMLGAHDFSWLRLDPPAVGHRHPGASDTAPFHAHPGSEPPFRVPLVPPLDRGGTAALEHALAERFRHHPPPFTTSALSDVTVVDVVTLPRTDSSLVISTLELVDDEPQTVVVPLLRRNQPAEGDSVVARTIDGDVLVDASRDQAMVRSLARLALSGERLRGRLGSLIGERGHSASPPALRPDAPLRTLVGDHTNISTVIAEQVVLKIFRRVDPGIHPEVEILRHLDEQGFGHAPRLFATLDHVSGGRPKVSTAIAIVAEYVPATGDLFQLLLDEATTLLETAASVRPPGSTTFDALRDPTCAAQLEEASHALGLLADRTALLHRTLARGSDPRLTPEPFTRHVQRSLYQTLRSRVHALTTTLARQAHLAPEAIRRLTDEAGWSARLLELIRDLLEVHHTPFDCDRIRIHGDLHLQHVLVRGRDLVFIDFEGPADRPVGERAIKRSPLLDVATLLRSIDDIRSRALRDIVERGVDDEVTARPVSLQWMMWAAERLVSAYRSATADTRLCPSADDDFMRLLDACLVDVLLGELTADLQQRPEHLAVSIAALERLVERHPPGAATDEGPDT